MTRRERKSSSANTTLAGYSSEQASRRTLAQRVASAVQRRWRYLGELLRGGPRRVAPAEAALEWLRQYGQNGYIPFVDDGLSIWATSLCLPTMLAYGQRKLVEDWSNWLLQDQTFWLRQFDRRPPAAAVVELGWRLQGLLPVEAALPQLSDVLEKMCQLTLRYGQPDGFPLIPPGTLFRAARRLEARDEEQRVRRIAAQIPQQVLLGRWPFGLTATVGFMLEVGFPDCGREMLKYLAGPQRSDGALRRVGQNHAARAQSTAEAAALWYRLGERKWADPMMDWLLRNQTPQGDFQRRFWPWSRRKADMQSLLAVKFFLDASLLQVASAFEDQAHTLPTSIATDDGRTQMVRQWLAGFASPDGAGSDLAGSNLAVADIGCGSGRFLRHLVEWFPQVRWTGIDLAKKMLAQVPAAVDPLCGHLLNLPVDDASFGAVFSVEVLEHALVPEAAIDELCRVTQAGGRILIVDKVRTRQPLSDHEPWERWFTAEEVCRWLEKHCRDVQVTPIAHGSPPREEGLFLGWTARKRS